MHADLIARGLLVVALSSALESMTPLPATALTVVQQQAGVVHGTVVDAGTGQPLASVQIHLDGTNRQTVTNESGGYIIADVPTGTYTVVATYIGYGTGRRDNVRVQTGQRVEVTFRLESTPLRLQDIVVTGLTDPTSGVKAPFVVGRVTAEDNVVPQLDALGALQGRVAGVSMARGGGQPGDDYDILLRSPTSIMRENSPMIVVDGVVLGTASLRDFDAMDIESIEVVKGAAAASLYGSRAAPGVIQIRTKSGSHIPRGETHFTLHTEIGREEVPPDRRQLKATATNHPYLTNSNGDYINEAGAVVDVNNRVIKADRIADQPYRQTFDHFNALIRPGRLQTTTITMSQNADNTRFYGSAGMTEETGVIVHNNGLTRQNFRLNLDHWANSTLNLGMTAYYARTKRQEVADPNPLYGVSFMPPDFDMTAPGEDGMKYRAVPEGTVQQSNPLYNQFYNEAETRTSRFIGGLTGSYAPTPWLRFEGNVGVDRSDREADAFWPVGFEQYASEERLFGRIDRRMAQTETFTSGLNARLMHRLGSLTLRHHLRVLYELEDRESTSTVGRNLAVSGVRNLAVANDRQFSSSSQQIRSEGYSAATGFDYAGRFVGDVLVRRDGSSLFGPADRWKTYYRASLAYRLAEEQWWPFDIITEFKPRFSIGTAGGRPNFADRFETWTSSSGQVSKQTLGNESLRPEKATETEFGLDMILANRVSLQLTRAQSKVEDQLLPIPLPGVIGYTHQWKNAGTLEGSTYEATLEASLISRPGRRWTMNMTWDRTRHELTEFPFACYTDRPTGSTSRDVYYRCAGYSMGSIQGRKLLRSHRDLSALHSQSHNQFQVNDDGYLVAVGEGNSWKDGISKGLWGTEVVVDGRTYQWGRIIPAIDDEGAALVTEIGNSDPDFSLALGTRLEIGPVSIGALFDGTFGGTVYNYEKRLAYRDYHADYDQLGKPEERKKPVDYYASLISDTYVDYFLEDGSYLKLRELAVSYALTPPHVLQRIGMTGLELSLAARNIYTWTAYTGWDPEIGTLQRRIREGAYPHLRTVSLAVRADF